jgi:hypothetical protein
MNHSIAIVTPLYKKTPSAAELASLKHSFSVLGGRQRFIVVPDELDLSEYQDVLNGCEIIRLDSKHFESLATYNRLMLSKCFYRLFGSFNYILLLQPDAIVFRDELDSWCARGYDYIGAPWPNGHKVRPFAIPTHPWINICMKRIYRPVRIYVGNGGLSLRKIHSALEVLNRHWLVARTWNYNEDGFWSLYSGSVPAIKEASMFAMEQKPSFYFKLNGNLLPLGCHAWEKYEPEFWRAQFQLEGCMDLPQENK